MKRLQLLKEFLSNYKECHSFVIGIYCGLTEWHGIENKHFKNPDVKAEPHYCYGGYIVGTLLRWAIILTAGYTFFGMM